MEKNLDQQIADLILENYHLAIRLGQQTKTDIEFAELRANIAQQLWQFNLYLDENDQVQKMSLPIPKDVVQYD